MAANPAKPASLSTLYLITPAPGGFGQQVSVLTEQHPLQRSGSIQELGLERRALGPFPARLVLSCPPKVELYRNH
jgi:hypothetical protein